MYLTVHFEYNSPTEALRKTTQFS